MGVEMIEPSTRLKCPPASSPKVRFRMQSMPRKDTSPEMAVRRRLHGMGLRYRVHFPPLRGVRRRADVVFLAARVAVFIDGCFWHGCPLHGHSPKSNTEWWAWKI